MKVGRFGGFSPGVGGFTGLCIQCHTVTADHPSEKHANMMGYKLLQS